MLRHLITCLWMKTEEKKLKSKRKTIQYILYLLHLPVQSFEEVNLTMI